jgi:hypothetical protein
MLKKLLSDSINVLNPSYQSDSFQPYLSTIITIITITFIGYGFQTATIGIYTYANNPGLFKDKIQTRLCGDFRKISLVYICRGVQNKSIKDYTVTSLLSPEQDIHRLMN